MSEHGLNLAPLFLRAGISVAAGTPLASRALRASPRPARIVLDNLACLGAAGLSILLLGLIAYRSDEMVQITVFLSAALQGVAAVIQSLLPRRA